MLRFFHSRTREAPSDVESALPPSPNGDASEIELSDVDLEQVVGGLERAYVLDPAIALRTEDSAHVGSLDQRAD